MSEEPIRTYGGAAGVAVRVADLEQARSVLALASTALDEARWALAATASAWDPGGGSAAAVVEAMVAADHEAGSCRDLSASLTAAVAAYVQAERAAASGPALVTRAGEVVADAAGTAWWELRWGAAVATALAGPLGLPALLLDGGPRRLAPSGLPPHTSWLNGETADGATRALGDDYDRIVASLACALSAAEAGEPSYAGVVPEPGARRVVLRDPGLEGTLRRLEWTEELGGGAVAIETIAAPDGSRRHVVYVPGTQDWWVTDPNPADAQANLAAVTGGPTDAGRAVRDALAAHGVGADEPVMLAGHSQGGMIAAIGATALADRYRVTHVVTAGSPTGRIPTPAGVATLHLENSRDVVPGLDGRRNPDTRDRVTVVHDRRRSRRADRPDGSRTVAEAHALEGYAATAREVDRGVGASDRAWTGSAAGFLGGGPSAVSVYRPAP